MDLKLLPCCYKQMGKNRIPLNLLPINNDIAAEQPVSMADMKRPEVPWLIGMMYCRGLMPVILLKNA